MEFFSDKPFSMAGLAMLALGAAAWLLAWPDSISIATVGPQTTSATAEAIAENLKKRIVP